MAITRGFTDSFGLELTQAIHDLDSDTLKMALYSDSASLGASTTAYSTSNEIAGTGYSAGGAAMTISSGYPITGNDGLISYRFDTVTWGQASFTARGALCYNSSKANRSVFVLDFGQNRTVVIADFKITFPLSLPAIITLSKG